MSMTHLNSKHLVIVLAATLFGCASTPNAARPQTQPATWNEGSLRLASRGSFMVGGDVVHQTAPQLSSIYDAPPTNGGSITVNQMYVEFMVPETVTGLPVVMLHGATLSGKSYDTTPDGRMGWYEYFVRHGHPTYVPDQVSRGRSGADFALYNDVRAGRKPASALPNVFRIADQLVWTMFRFGPAYGHAFPDEQFPTQSIAELSRQAIPDLNATLPTPNPNVTAMAALAKQLRGAVLVGHSETGALPLEAALIDADGIKALILVEPGSCTADKWSTDQLGVFAEVPILIVFGDHVDVNTGTPGFSWADALVDCQKFAARLQAASGNAQVLHLPERGVVGNSHMMMMDKNNLQVADLLLQWISSNAKK